VNPALTEAVAECLGVSSGDREAEQLRKYSPRDWKRTLGWLDNSGLALYLHRRLQELDATDVLPAAVLSRLERNLVDNRRRVEQMTNQLETIHQEFDRAGIKYIFLKGFSLVPAFCPNADLRAPNDFDYLIDPKSVAAARHALEEIGYRLTRKGETELGFDKPTRRIPSPCDSPYDAATEASVELHLDLWDSEQHMVQLESPGFVMARSVVGGWRGLHFPVLRDSEAFLLQVLHVFQHLLHGWVKMSWLLEIGFFMDRRSTDSAFWEEFNQRLEASRRVEEFAAIVTSLVAKVFRSRQPEAARGWNRSLRPAARIWLECYAKTWVFADHPFSESRWLPPAKLSLLLHQAYLADPQLRKEYVRHRLFPWKRPPATPAAIQMETAESAPRQLRFVMHLLSFHAGAGLRYAWELPHWRGLNRSASSADGSDLPGPLISGD
jgi:hypothetical protein